MTVHSVAIGEVAVLNPKQPISLRENDLAVPFLPMAAVGADGDAPNEQLRRLADLTSGYAYFEKGDVLLAKITPCFENGKVAHLDSLSHPFGFGSTEFHVLRAGPAVEPRYLYHAVRNPHFRRAGASSMTGSAGQRRVPATFVARHRIPLPALSEQKRIAAMLDKAESIRRKRCESLRLLDTFLGSVFVRMFGDPVANEKGWMRARAAAAIRLIEPGTSVKGDDKPPGPTEWAVLKISAVTSGWYLPSECKTVAAPPDRPINPKRGDLLFSRANTRELVAATCLVDRNVDRVFLPDKLWRITANPEVATAEFLRFLFADLRFRRVLTGHATGTSGSMLNVSQEKLLGVEVPLPPLGLQREFAKVVWKTFDLREHMLAAIEQSDEFLKTTTRQAFNRESTRAGQPTGRVFPPSSLA